MGGVAIAFIGGLGYFFSGLIGGSVDGLFGIVILVFTYVGYSGKGASLLPISYVEGRMRKAGQSVQSPAQIARIGKRDSLPGVIFRLGAVALHHDWGNNLRLSGAYRRLCNDRLAS